MDVRVMPDLGKTIRGLECCLSGKHPIPCDKCDYFGDEEYYDVWSCRLSLMRDALSLLKAQEPRRPIKSPNYNYSYYGYNCSKCGHTLHVGEYRPNYCEECGQAVKWE